MDQSPTPFANAPLCRFFCPRLSEIAGGAGGGHYHVRSIPEQLLHFRRHVIIATLRNFGTRVECSIKCVAISAPFFSSSILFLGEQKENGHKVKRYGLNESCGPELRRARNTVIVGFRFPQSRVKTKD